jgi:hypothetical protein
VHSACVERLRSAADHLLVQWLRDVRGAVARQRAWVTAKFVIAFDVVIALVVLTLAVRGTVAAVLVVAMGLFWFLAGRSLHALGPSDRARALQEKYESIPGDRRWQRRNRGHRRLLQQDDIKPDRAMTAGSCGALLGSSVSLPRR